MNPRTQSPGAKPDSPDQPREWTIRKKRPEPFDTEFGSIVGPAADFPVTVVERASLDRVVEERDEWKHAADEGVQARKCQAFVDAMYEAFKEALEHPHPLLEPPSRHFDHVLGTFGHAYTIQGFREIIEERDRLAQAVLDAKELIDTGEFADLDPIIDLARAALQSGEGERHED